MSSQNKSLEQDQSSSYSKMLDRLELDHRQQRYNFTLNEIYVEIAETKGIVFRIVLPILMFFMIFLVFIIFSEELLASFIDKIFVFLDMTQESTGIIRTIVYIMGFLLPIFLSIICRNYVLYLKKMRIKRNQELLRRIKLD